MPYPYLARNGPFKTLRELLLVRGVTEALFYGEDTNLNGRLDYNERDGDESYPVDNGDYVLNKGWAAYLTCYSSSTTQTQSNQSQSQNQTSQTQNDQTQNNQTQNNQNQTNQTQNNQNQNNQNQNTQNNQSQNSQNQTNQTQNNQNQNSQSSQNSTEQSYAQVNVNTASEVILAALLGGDDNAVRAAQSIIGSKLACDAPIDCVHKAKDSKTLQSTRLEALRA